MALTCGVCSRKIDRYDDYISRRDKCVKSFHLRCVNVSMDEFIRIKKSGVIKEWSCGTCDGSIASGPDDLSDDQSKANSDGDINSIITVHVNNAIQKLIEAVIKPLQDEILKLSEQNRILLNEIRVLQNVTSQDSARLPYQSKDGAQRSKHETFSVKDKTSQVNGNKDQCGTMKSDKNELLNASKYLSKTKTREKQRGNNDSKGDVVKRQASAVVASGHTGDGNSDVSVRDGGLDEPRLTIDGGEAALNSDAASGASVQESGQESVVRTDGWNVARSGKSRKRSGIVGVDSSARGGLRAVHKCVDLHICMLHPSTTANDLEDYLRPSFPEVSCEAVTPRYPEKYSSFKVRLFDSNFKKAMNPAEWPEGVLIRKFFYQRRATLQSA